MGGHLKVTFGHSRRFEPSSSTGTRSCIISPIQADPTGLPQRSAPIRADGRGWRAEASRARGRGAAQGDARAQGVGLRTRVMYRSEMCTRWVALFAQAYAVAFRSTFRYAEARTDAECPVATCGVHAITEVAIWSYIVAQRAEHYFAGQHAVMVIDSQTRQFSPPASARAPACESPPGRKSC